MSSDPGGSEQSEDPIIYFTLIDFLIQLLVLGLFAASVWAFYQQKITNEQANIPSWVKQQEYLPLLKGLSPLVDAGNARQLTEILKKLNDKALLEKLINFLNRADRPVQTLQACAANPERCTKILSKCQTSEVACEQFANADAARLAAFVRSAPGLPACIEAGPNALFTLLATDGDNQSGQHYLVKSVSDVGRKVIQELGGNISKGMSFKKSDTQQLFSMFAPRKLGCAHSIKYVRDTDSEDMRRTMERWFYLEFKRLDE